MIFMSEPETEVTANFAIQRRIKGETLKECVHESLQNYFSHLDGYSTADLYKLVISEVEQPLFEEVMRHCGGNQTHASRLLGISRGTLRKKLSLYGLD